MVSLVKSTWQEPLVGLSQPESTLSTLLACQGNDVEHRGCNGRYFVCQIDCRENVCSYGSRMIRGSNFAAMIVLVKSTLKYIGKDDLHGFRLTIEAAAAWKYGKEVKAAFHGILCLRLCFDVAGKAGKECRC